MGFIGLNCILVGCLGCLFGYGIRSFFVVYGVFMLVSINGRLGFCVLRMVECLVFICEVFEWVVSIVWFMLWGEWFVIGLLLR